MADPRSAFGASSSRGRPQRPGEAGSAAALEQPASTLNPVAFARRRFRAWWQARLPLSDTLTLTQSRDASCGSISIASRQ